MHKVTVLVGSLRRDSINRKFARALAALGAGQFVFDHADLDLPLYNDDLWQDPPEDVLALKRAILAADAVLFVTPEYNRSIPAVMKNALDWASRPPGESVWKGKPAAIAGATSGTVGTAVAQSHLRSILPVLGVWPLAQPEVYFQYKPDAIDTEERFTDPKTRDFMSGFLAAFDAWIRQVSPRA